MELPNDYELNSALSLLTGVSGGGGGQVGYSNDIIPTDGSTTLASSTVLEQMT